ncbi:cytochrome c oxidase subunit I [Haloarchaeobius iranensis]|uniref:Cytochrome c oxidase subunit 1 n=1 Tax=Haloarchaeobius iranensis TaxID=996166 RepID=A0A1G9UA53_9EURY|nr:cbb3-type cytochrome c oxidase subunit I [Haloarchaeobius iranensis]SDM56811.1 cytochrome c oxidase subunit 1 [Haloarchaeobius iranensis]
MFGRSTYDYDDDGFRRCSVTGLDIHRSAEDMVKLYGLTAILALAVGGVFAVFVALTRWEVVGLLSPGDFYTYLSIHAWNLLIFWMVFMEIAILYVGGPFVLGRKLALPSLAKAGYVAMLAGAVTVNAAIWLTSYPNNAPLLTSYVPLESSWQFYLGALVFVLGAIVAALPFFATMWREKRENPNATLPLVAFGAFATSIIAFEALVGGVLTYGPALLWRLEILATLDSAFYRQMYWIIGHGSQQINLLAMITVWYFITHVVGGAEVASQKVSRTAFVLYIFFINMGAAHHLMSDPVVSTGWRMWNTSYAAYGAVLASMIHAFAIPAGLEAGRRAKGKGGGLFGWLWSGPWDDPGFSATILSIVLFGFLGGITGVMMGQMQLNMTWHNTLAVPGHFHATVATGTTLAFMGLGYYVLRLVFGREWSLGPIAKIQPFLYGGAMGVTVVMMMYAGVLFGVPRRHPTVMDIPGTEFSFEAAAPFFAIFGVGALVSIVGGALFVVVALATLFTGDEFEGGPVGDLSRTVADGGGSDHEPVHEQSMRGTFVLTLVFFATFVVLTALNWYLLSNIWGIGP